MSFVPILVNDGWDDLKEYPLRSSRQLNTHVGVGSFPDLLLPFSHVPYKQGGKRPWLLANWPRGKQDLAAVGKSQDGSQISVDVRQFLPEEISVKMVDNFIAVEGKHEEKQDEHGFVSRHFVRKFMLPDGHDTSKVVSSLSSHGILTIKAPKLTLIDTDAERMVPVELTGRMAK